MVKQRQHTRKSDSHADVDFGSKPGKRWFVSKWAELLVTVKPARRVKHNDGGEELVSGEQIAFVKSLKPYVLRGSGKLGRGSVENDGTDSNDALFWGIYATDNEAQIDFLRGMAQYRHTTQDNKIDRHMEIKELTWDPTGLAKGPSGQVISRRQDTFGPGETSELEPPAEVTPPPTKGRVALSKARG